MIVFSKRDIIIITNLNKELRDNGIFHLSGSKNFFLPDESQQLLKAFMEYIYLGVLS